MKAAMTFAVLASLLIVSCEKSPNDGKVEVGKGFEIYLTTTPYSNNLDMDYSLVNIDTIALEDTPILRYNDLVSYDTTNHKITLRISHDSLKIGDAGVYGRMFVVTIDKNPIYVGFKWPVISSVSCSWVYVEEPYAELDHLNDNEIVISCSSNVLADPRLDKRIVDQLKTDGKIK